MENMKKNKSKAFISWSGGKDTSLSFYKAVQEEGVEIACLLNMVSEDGSCSRTHGVSADLLQLQADSIGLPIIQRRTTWENYEEEFKKALEELGKEDIRTGVFGDIDLAEHRDWVERVCGDMGVRPVFPLWKKEREEILGEFIDSGFKAVIVATRTSCLDENWLGRDIDNELIKDLKSVDGVDICGEKGEYHSFVYDGPIFNKTVGFSIGENRFTDIHCLLRLNPVKQDK